MYVWLWVGLPALLFLINEHEKCHKCAYKDPKGAVRRGNADGGVLYTQTHTYTHTYSYERNGAAGGAEYV